MNQIVPPVCFILALLLVIGGFAALSLERPQPSMQLHRAYVDGDVKRQEILEAQLTQQRVQRIVLIGSLFGMAVAFVGVGFVVMQPRD